MMKGGWHSKRAVLLGLLLCVGLIDGQAQATPFNAAQVAELLPSPGILLNKIEEMHAEGNSLWVGTEDGLFQSPDFGLTWRGFRAEVPLSPEGLPPVVPSERVPRVEAYAYPNPFSPSADRFVRIRYTLEDDEQVEIRLFDFAMNLVRDLTDEQQTGGEWEVSWDGTDDNGARVANGTYFYAVEAGGETFWGKVLVLE